MESLPDRRHAKIEFGFFFPNLLRKLPSLRLLSTPLLSCTASSLAIDRLQRAGFVYVKGEQPVFAVSASARLRIHSARRLPWPSHGANSLDTLSSLPSGWQNVRRRRPAPTRSLVRPDYPPWTAPLFVTQQPPTLSYNPFVIPTAAVASPRCHCHQLLQPLRRSKSRNS